MPLPNPGTTWPPQDLTTAPPKTPTIDAKLHEWSTWYAGNPEQLEAEYARSGPGGPRMRPSQYRGGVVGAMSRFFWGRPSTQKQAPTRLHIPIAADIASASADLLFADPPTLTIDKHTATQDQIQVYFEDGLHTQLATAAEVCAALGGVYLQACWDRDLAEHAFLHQVHADAVWPVFRYGRLVSAVVWHVLSAENGRVIRHVESHELDGQGVGVVFHGLYEGTDTNLGRLVPLTEHPTTAGIEVNADGYLSTESPGLDLVYVANQSPQRLWRNHPVGAYLGRSDYDGVEGLMDALDETWSSWMRDIRLAKARILAAQSMLQDLGPGQGAVFDPDQEVFTPINALPAREGSGLPIEKIQFDIRTADHDATTKALSELICRTAGYSSQTFGENLVAGEQTATEVTARERRSYLTRDRKIRAFTAPIAQVVNKMLLIDRHILGMSGLEPSKPQVAFGDSVQATPEQLARTASLLEQAGAASTEVRVQLVHPEWTEQQVKDEVEKIYREQGLTVPDPTGFNPENPTVDQPGE